MTPNQFLEWERAQPERHHYWHGEVFAMTGGTDRHALLIAEMTRLLGNRVRRPCRVFATDQRIALADDVFVYADVSVRCSQEHRRGADDTILNPKVVVEVLSKSTESYDRGKKKDGYLALPSVECLLLVSQWEPRVELHAREADGTFRAQTFGPGETVRLDAIATSFTIDELYDGAFEIPGE